MAAAITQGSSITIGGTTITGLTDITPPSATRGTIDITHLGSADHSKEYAAGMIDGGEMSCTVLVGVGSGIGAVAAMIEEYGASEQKSCSIALGEDGGSISFQGIVTKVSVEGIATGDNVIKATIGVKPVGLITYDITEAAAP